MSNAALNRNSLRSKLVVQKNGVCRTLDPSETVVFVSGTKSPEVVNSMLSATISVEKEMFGEKFVLAFRKHGGEKAEKPEDQERYERAWAERTKLLSDVWMIGGSSTSNPEWYALADMSVVSGGPTDTIVGAYARMGMVYYMNDDSKKMMKKSGSVDGTWWVAEYGGAYIALSGAFRGNTPFRPFNRRQRASSGIAGEKFLRSSEKLEYGANDRRRIGKNRRPDNAVSKISRRTTDMRSPCGERIIILGLLGLQSDSTTD